MKKNSKDFRPHVESLEPRMMLSTVQIFAAGSENTEVMNLQVDGQTVESWSNIGGDADAGDFQVFQWSTSENITADQVRIEFPNDLWDPASGIDTNLRIDAIAIDGVRFETEDPSVYSTGTWQTGLGIAPGNPESEFLNTNGYLQYSTSGVSESTNLTINARGFEGNEAFSLQIDGQTVQTWTDIGTSFSAYNHNAEGTVTADQIRVVFLNDQFDAATGLDSNLQVDNIVVGGVQYETEAPEVFSSGTWTGADGIVDGFGRGDTLHTNGYFEFGAEVEVFPGSFAFSQSEYSVQEQGAAIELRIDRIGGTDGTVSIDYATFDNSTTQQEDYQAVAATLTFADGEDFKLISIPIVQDSSSEGDESFGVRLSNASQGSSIETETALVTIVDDDPNITINARGDEGTESFALQIDGQTVQTWSNISTQFTSYNYYAPGTFTADQIRVVFLNDQFDSANGIDSNLTVDNIVIDGVQFETEAPNVFSTGSWTAADGIVAGFGRGETLNTDGYFEYGGEVITLPGNFSFSQTGYSIGEQTSSIQLRIDRLDGTDGVVSVDYATFDESATQQQDYSAVNGTLTFADGEEFRLISVPIIQDRFAEGEESFGVRLSNATDGSGIVTDTALIAIVDDEPDPGQGDGLYAQYYDNINFTGLANEGIDRQVNFDFGEGSPEGLGVDTFSIRWTGQVEALYSEEYTFQTTSDDGVRLWVNDQLIIDNWTNHAATIDTGTITLQARQRYNIRMEYFENGGDAVAELRWSSDSQPLELIPQSQLYSTYASEPGDGLYAEYYDNIDFTGLARVGVDEQVDFDFGRGAPEGLEADTFSIRWSGQIETLFSEEYTFHTTSDDGVRLWVNDQLIIENWTNHAPTVNTGTIALEAGRRYDIRMDYYENGGGSVAELRWSSESQELELIPQSRLYSSAQFTDGVRDLVVNGSFEEFAVDQDANVQVAPNQLGGWNSLNGNDIHLHGSGSLAVNSSDGSNHIELDNGPGGAVDGIYQDVETEAGKSYELNFDIRASGSILNNNDEAVVVEWNGVKLKSDGYRAVGGWTTVKARVVGTAGTDRLTFRESTISSANDGTGPYLDNISIKESGPVTYYVSVDGSDDHDYEQAQNRGTAWASIQRAVEAAVAGDTIVVGDGTYSEEVFLNNSGEDGREILIRAESQHGVRLLGFIHGRDVSHITVEGFDVTNREGGPITEGFVFYDSHHITIRNNIARGSYGGGIQFNQSDWLLIEGNITHGNAFLNRDRHSGISVYQARDLDSDDREWGIIIRNNVSYGNKNLVGGSPGGGPTDGNGIVLDDFKNEQRGTDGVAYSRPTLVENNLLYGNGGHGIHLHLSHNVDIRNNTGVGNGTNLGYPTGDLSLSASDDIRAYNNVFSGIPHRQAVKLWRVENEIVENNLIDGQTNSFNGSGNLFVDADFEPNSYRLTPGAQGFGWGSNLDHQPVDISAYDEASLLAWSFTKHAITNASLEATNHVNGGSSGGAPNWSFSGSGGDWDPTNQFLAGQVDGQNVGYINSGSASKDLGLQYGSDRTYIIDIDVGARTDQSDAGFEVVLYAGSTAILRRSGTLSGDGQMKTVSLIVVDQFRPNLAGQDLSIEVRKTSGGQLNFDNLKSFSTKLF